MAYIKGIFINDIYTNPSNGYTVGLLRVKESDIPEEVNKVVTFTGIFDELKYKAEKEIVRTPGSVAFVPSVAGIMVAGFVINNLIKQ